MAALVFLVETLLSLALWAFLLRLLLQWVRADFRNPLARALVQITSPVLVPLRRVLPAIGRFDTASGLLVLVLALAHAASAPLLYTRALPAPPAWALLALFTILRTTLWTWSRCGIGAPTIANPGGACRAAAAPVAPVTPARCAGSPRGRRASRR